MDDPAAWIGLLDKVSHFGVVPSMLVGAAAAWKLGAVVLAARDSIIERIKAQEDKQDERHEKNITKIGEVSDRVSKIEGHLGIE